ncbi:MAG: biotin/lipoyl-containing protein, partial [Deefgea sp.]
VFFYGLSEHEEATAELEPGKGLIMTLQGQNDVPADGEVKIFFELNGQPRTVCISKNASEAKGDTARAGHPRAEVGNPLQIGAPMPGMVVTVAVKAGQHIEKGDTLLAVEAMKMETAIRAEFAAKVKEVLVKRGSSVKAHDLLIVLEAL